MKINDIISAGIAGLIGGGVIGLCIHHSLSAAIIGSIIGGFITGYNEYRHQKPRQL